jgi:hypothetical protein
MSIAHNTNPAGNPRISEMSVSVPPMKRPDRPEDFTRFEELAGKLVGVPKEELDEKLKNES